MRSSRIASAILILLTLAVTESALAFCPSPLPEGVYCCNFDDTLTLRAAFNSNGLLTGSGIVENRIPADEYAYSRGGCRTEARLPFDSLARAAGCPALAELPPISTYSSAIITPDGHGGSFGTENFSTIYRAYAPYVTPGGTPVVAVCLDLRGVTSWVNPLPCDIEDMPPFSATDTCSIELETNNGLPGPTTTCPAVPVMTRTSGEPSFKTKMETIGIPYAGPTSTIRTTAYNQHLATVWKYHERHQRLSTNPNQWYACTARRAVVEAEVTTKHGLTYPPAIISRHLTGRAFDVSRTVIADLRQSGVFIPAILIRTPVSTLNWGGRFRIPDRVHFELNVP